MIQKDSKIVQTSQEPQLQTIVKRSEEWVRRVFTRKRTDLTDKQAKYLENRQNWDNKYQAAIKAGYSIETAENATRSIEYPIKQKSANILQAYQVAWITNDLIAEQTAKLIHWHFKREVTTNDGQIKELNFVDPSSIYKWLELVHKVRWDFAPEKMIAWFFTTWYENISDNDLDEKLLKMQKMLNIW